MRLVQGRVVERVLWQLRADRAVPLELFDEIGSQAARIEKPLQLDRGQLLKLSFRVIRSALLPDARANLPHDLLDVHRIGSDVEVGHFFP
jgi:hypothetical protein